MAALRLSARSLTLVTSSTPTKKASLLAASKSTDAAITGATSSMYEKDRVWSPSPNMVMGCSRMIWLIKMPIAFRNLSARF